MDYSSGYGRGQQYRFREPRRTSNMSTTRFIEPRIAINTIEEADTLADIVDYMAKNIHVWADYSVLWALSRFNFADIDSQAVRSVLPGFVSMSKDLPELKRAIVVDSDLGFGMMRMLQLLGEDKFHYEIRVFRERDEAIEWLSEPPG